MLFAGVDVAASKPVAVALVSADNEVVDLWRGADTSGLTGAQRLATIAGGLRLMNLRGLAAAMVEIPHQSFLLNGVAALAMTELQTQSPGAVVLDMNVGQWRKAYFGRAPKSAEAKAMAIDAARVTGYDGGDEDLSEALCLAMLARQLWLASSSQQAA